MKELNNFRKFLSENTMPDFTIMGETFNFSDICPSAHKLVQNQAIVHQGFSKTAPTVLNFAIKHRKFFNLERKALGSMGITVDEYNDDVTRLYTEILNIAEKLGVRKKAKEYMDMHMAKIKDTGFKASEPGGSSDRNFKGGYYDPTDKELDFADEIEYEQDWRDEQDALFGKIREVRSRLENEIEGYTDLHENDVILKAFLGESNKENLNEEKYIVTISKNGTTTETNVHNTKEDAEAQAKKINGGFMDRPDAKFKAVVSKDVNENLEEGPIQTFTQGLDTYTKYPHVFVFKVRTMSMDKQGGKFVHDSRYEIEEDMTFNEAVKQAEYFISLPETIGVNVNLYYTTGNTEGQLGGQVEVLRWTHDAWYMGAKSDYIKNAQANQFEDEEAERIIAIRKWLNSSSIGRQPQNVDNQEESWSTSTSSMKQKVADILATK